MKLKVIGFNSLDDCEYQVSTWENDRKDLEFVIKQMDKYKAKWHLKQDASGKVAVFGAIAPTETYYNHSSGLEDM